METPTEKDRPVQFRDFLYELGEGEAHQQLTEALARVTKAMRLRALADHRGVKGQIKLTVSLVTDEQLVVAAKWDLDVKEPKPPKPGSTLWLDKFGNLTPQNPKQQNLPGMLREVPGGRVAPRDVVDPATGEVLGA